MRAAVLHWHESGKCRRMGTRSRPAAWGPGGEGGAPRPVQTPDRGDGARTYTRRSPRPRPPRMRPPAPRLPRVRLPAGPPGRAAPARACGGRPASPAGPPRGCAPRSQCRLSWTPSPTSPAPVGEEDGREDVRGRRAAGASGSHRGQGRVCSVGEDRAKGPASRRGPCRWGRRPPPLSLLP